MRIVAGTLGGRTLVSPKGMTTRPTSDRVREALFSILGNIDDANVCDLYAGTGALGIEAISRGAKFCVFVDHARTAVEAIQRNIDSLGLQHCTTIVQRDVEKCSAILRSHSFELVFADPPYANLLSTMRYITPWLSTITTNDARLILEHSKNDFAPAVPAFEPKTSRTYGDTTITVYQRI